MLPQIDPEKIVDDFSMQCCFWTVAQHCTGNYLEQCKHSDQDNIVYFVTLMLFKIGVLKNFLIFTGEHRC